MTEAVVLGDLELGAITRLVIDEQRKLARHPIPGWDGDLVQDLGSAAVLIRIQGLDHGDDADTPPGQVLEALRSAAAAGEPLDFTASAAAASRVEQVLIRRLQVEQRSGLAAGYLYDLECIQYVEPPPPLVAGFDAGFLDQVGDLAGLAALADAADAIDGLGDLAGEALSAIEDGLEVLDEIQDLVEGAQTVAPLLEAAGALVSAGAWTD